MGSYQVKRCRAVSCRMPIFFAPTERGKIGIFDATIPEHATATMQRVWLDDDGVAHFVAKDRPAPAGKPLFTNHWLTCRDAAHFAEERLRRRRQS
ncbi:MAG TPA: hypothetical protein VH475_23980 [Tepidisphaeraceae bacterium]|jgi:hypothetical protein